MQPLKYGYIAIYFVFVQLVKERAADAAAAAAEAAELKSGRMASLATDNKPKVLRSGVGKFLDLKKAKLR